MKIRDFFKQFALYELLRSWIISTRDGIFLKVIPWLDQHKPAILPEELKEVVREYIKIGKEHGFQVILILEVNKESLKNPKKSDLSKYYEAVKNVGYYNDIPVIDTINVLKQIDMQHVFLDEVHLTAEANKTLARAIANEILKQVRERKFPQLNS